MRIIIFKITQTLNVEFKISELQRTEFIVYSFKKNYFCELNQPVSQTTELQQNKDY